jgi:hypothetical protein
MAKAKTQKQKFTGMNRSQLNEAVKAITTHEMPEGYNNIIIVENALKIASEKFKDSKLTKEAYAKQKDELENLCIKVSNLDEWETTHIIELHSKLQGSFLTETNSETCSIPTVDQLKKELANQKYGRIYLFRGDRFQICFDAKYKIVQLETNYSNHLVGDTYVKELNWLKGHVEAVNDELLGAEEAHYVKVLNHSGKIVNYLTLRKCLKVLVQSNLGKYKSQLLSGQAVNAGPCIYKRT